MSQINILNNPNNMNINIADYFIPSAMRTMHLDGWPGSINVTNEIACYFINNDVDNAYISMTGIAHAFKPNVKAAKIIGNWMRTKSAQNYLSIWEYDHGNTKFTPARSSDLRTGAYNSANVSMSPQKWVQETNAIGIVCTNRGVFAHHTIALEFAASLSDSLRYYVNTEFERLKKMERFIQENNRTLMRDITRTNFNELRDAITKFIAPFYKGNVHDVYAQEVDMLNVIVMGMKAKAWRELNPERARRGENMRDDEEIADFNTLYLLNIMQIKDAQLIGCQLYNFEQRKQILEQEADRIAADIIAKAIQSQNNTRFAERFGGMPMPASQFPIPVQIPNGAVQPIIIQNPNGPINVNIPQLAPQPPINNANAEVKPEKKLMYVIITDDPPMELFKNLK